MAHLDIPQTASTPLISFDPEVKKLRISGESYPENSFAFYAPVLAWLKQYLQDNRQLTIAITITYMNSSSTKCMLDLLDIMEDAYGRSANVSITWYYDLENPRSFELAEEFCEEVSFPFEIAALNK
ncbi:DUF1987 domain-containing protein [Trichlorobacter lovleyi]|jgi:Domain of unknown function (DUF1987).|uniref:SiaC family regulatory phosphoprotein domain-containing protein n=1 Tax=Trichlorobacter lovleyi (strain ATCC BAA-1151 / DSM 17278 / SZ) TaxID=398767 RepID=B3E3K9_TRIL1|nr:SiaC family regulatory phosphoprotein [Trichlorobacter lovleyi]ACD95828.1 conserved hypothetical protein [Trichlorobacter lovleyi SZ]